MDIVESGNLCGCSFWIDFLQLMIWSTVFMGKIGIFGTDRARFAQIMPALITIGQEAFVADAIVEPFRLLDLTYTAGLSVEQFNPKEARGIVEDQSVQKVQPRTVLPPTKSLQHSVQQKLKVSFPSSQELIVEIQHS